MHGYLPPSARQTPPGRGRWRAAPEGERWPRRAGGRELCHCPKYFGLPQTSLPQPLRRQPPRRGGQEGYPANNRKKQENNIHGQTQ